MERLEGSKTLFVQADPVQQAGPDPCRVAVAAPGDHRHAHPQGLAGGGGAVIGEGVERNIRLAVQREMGLLPRNP